MYRPSIELRDERRLRRLYILFTLALAATLVICATIGILLLAPSAKLVRLGAEAKFANAASEPVSVAISQLDVSQLIPNRPTLSEDVVFVVRDGVTLRAFLGTDPSNGCFLSWQQARQVFVDACQQQTYGFTGRNTNQLATARSRPIDMVELPLTIENGVLFIEDRILRRDLR